MSKKVWFAFSLLAVASLVITACTPQTVEVEVTRVVTEREEVEVPVEVTVEVERVVEVPAEAEAEGPIAADGLEPCQPLPAAALGTGGSRLAARAAGSQPALRAAQTRVEAPVARPAQQAAAVYRVGVFEDVTTLNYWAGNGPDNTIWNAYMYPERLALYSLVDKFFDFVPKVAVDLPAPLTQEGDFWVVEIPIRDDIAWSDGEPFTAADLAFTADTVLRFGLISGNWSNWYDANFLDHIEAVDDFTVKIFYHTKPGLARHEYGTLGAPILAEHYWAPVVAEAAAPIDGLAADASDEAVLAAQQEAQDVLFAHEPAGEPTAGAFTLTSREPGAFVDLSAYPGYFQTGVTVTKYANGAYQEADAVFYGSATGDVTLSYDIGPHVASAVYSVYGSQDAALLALRQGEVDFVLNPLGLQRGLAEQVRGDANLSVIENGVNGFRYLAFNHRRRPMNDCAFRQAVAVLIDKEFVTQTILQGVAFPLYSYVPEANEAWYFDDVPKLGQGLTREARTNLAIAILEQAGYSWQGDVKPAWNPDGRHVDPGGRLLMPDGVAVPPLTLVAPSAGYDPLRSTFAVWIESWLNEFGIPTTAKLAGFNVIVPIIFTEQNFDMYELGWGLGIFPDYLRDFFASEQAVVDGNNAAGYVNPEFDALADQLLSCESVEACKALADEIQLMLATETPYVLLFDTGIIEAYRSASIEFPFTEGLSGLQYAHYNGDIENSVNVK